MKWYNGSNHTIITFEISGEGRVTRVVYLGESTIQKILSRKPYPSSAELLLSNAELERAFCVAVNTNPELVSELSQILKGKDAEILESVILFKIEECNGWLSNLKRD